MPIPSSLRRWFIIHFAVDYLFAVPLFFFPVQVLTLLGWTNVDPLATRLVAAAMFGIGGVSLLAKNADTNIIRQLLNLKIIWSLSAIAGIALSIIEGAPAFSWLALGLFVIFSVAWIYYRKKLK